MWLKKKGNIFFYFKQLHKTPPTVCLVWDLRADQEKKRFLLFLFCQFTSVQQIHILSFWVNLSLVWISSVPFSLVCFSRISGFSSGNKYLFLRAPSDYPPLHHAHVLPSSWHQVAVIVQEGHVGHVTAVATIRMAGSLKGKALSSNKLCIKVSQRRNLFYLFVQKIILGLFRHVGTSTRALFLTLNCEQG